MKHNKHTYVSRIMNVRGKKGPSANQQRSINLGKNFFSSVDCFMIPSDLKNKLCHNNCKNTACSHIFCLIRIFPQIFILRAQLNKDKVNEIFAAYQ